MASIALAQQLERLRDQADACRRTAIALDAKLRVIEAEQGIGSLRERLLASQARIDRAVGALTERQGLRPRVVRERK